MRHMLEHFSFFVWTLQCQHCMSTLWLLHTLFFTHCVCGFCLLLFLLFHTVVASHYVVFLYTLCVYSIEQGFGSYTCTCNMRTYTSILCAHTRAHLQPFEINIVQPCCFFFLCFWTTEDAGMFAAFAALLLFLLVLNATTAPVDEQLLELLLLHSNASCCCCCCCCCCLSSDKDIAMARDRSSFCCSCHSAS